MDKETLSNYGWIVICVLVLAVMIALAGPFGTFVAGAVKSTTAGLFGVNQNALGAAGIEIGDQAFANCEHLETEIRNATADYSGDTCCKACGAVLSTGKYVIPEGAVYYVGVGNTKLGDYTGATATYTAGDGFPATVSDGDVYVCGDYEYRYNMQIARADTTPDWTSAPTQNGWSVRVRDYIKSSYGEILNTINGKNVTNATFTFYGCSILVESPAIPDTINYMWGTYHSCGKLTTVPAKINQNVTSVGFIFENCTSLTGNIEIPCTAQTASNIGYSNVTIYHYDGCGH